MVCVKIKQISIFTHVSIQRYSACTKQGGYRDPSSRNITVAGEVAMISDLEFVKRRVAQDLERLTRPECPSRKTLA